MYVATGKLGGARGLAGSHRVLGRRLGRRLGQDDGGIDWGSIITQGITVAGQDAAVALKPPTYSASTVYNPTTGQYTSSTTSYAATGGAGLTSPLGTASLTSWLSSPLVLLGGVALIAVVLLRNR